jgi:hypothetical protein
MDLPEERDMDHLLNSLEQHERKGEPYNSPAVASFLRQPKSTPHASAPGHFRSPVQSF